MSVVSQSLSGSPIVGSKEIFKAEELDIFFEALEPIKIEEMTGKWNGGLFFTSSFQRLLLDQLAIFKWVGKNFKNENRVQALIMSFLGLFKFGLPFFGSAVARTIQFRGKDSAAMVYNYMPFIDHFRRIDDSTVMGIMTAKGEVVNYFYAIKK